MGLFSTNDFYCLEHNWIVSIANTVVAHLAVRWLPLFFNPNFLYGPQTYSFSPGYVGGYKSTLVGLGLPVSLWYRITELREREKILRRVQRIPPPISFFFLAKVPFHVSNDHFLNTFITTFFLSLVLMFDDL